MSPIPRLGIRRSVSRRMEVPANLNVEFALGRRLRFMIPNYRTAAIVGRSGRLGEPLMQEAARATGRAGVTGKTSPEFVFLQQRSAMPNPPVAGARAGSGHPQRTANHRRSGRSEVNDVFYSRLAGTRDAVPAAVGLERRP